MFSSYQIEKCNFLLTMTTQCCTVYSILTYVLWCQTQYKNRVVNNFFKIFLNKNYLRPSPSLSSSPQNPAEAGPLQGTHYRTRPTKDDINLNFFLFLLGTRMICFFSTATLHNRQWCCIFTLRMGFIISRRWRMF